MAPRLAVSPRRKVRRSWRPDSTKSEGFSLCQRVELSNSISVFPRKHAWTSNFYGAKGHSKWSFLLELGSSQSPGALKSGRSRSPSI